MGIKQISEAEEIGDIHLTEPWHREQFDEWKFNVKNTEQEYLEDIKALGWEETHRQWDEDYNCWTADLDGFFVVLAHLTERGYDVTFDEDVLEAYARHASGDAVESDI